MSRKPRSSGESIKNASIAKTYAPVTLKARVPALARFAKYRTPPNKKPKMATASMKSALHSYRQSTETINGEA
ncbi:hypothetical protein NX784_25000 [Massilia pinisoli]|uniref:Uncharacterized protein n=1 Tax=Massilia pinisoli TaxID=1772194 RepID=A0ABT1ZY39_9BURK|nr:hypothetical protein [Massilia pinisoli]MCS0584850.1 hypothetical protein [Massilia pinisoli]